MTLKVEPRGGPPRAMAMGTLVERRSWEERRGAAALGAEGDGAATAEDARGRLQAILVDVFARHSVVLAEDVVRRAVIAAKVADPEGRA